LLSFSFADSLPATPENYVVDLARVLDRGKETTLNRYLKELEEKTTVQFVVLTINSLDGLSIEDFSLQAAEKWKLGQRGKDNGLLLTVALKDRKYRFEVGYGLEETLPDSLVGSIGRELMVPSFQKGMHARGIADATYAVINRIAKAHNVTISGVPKVSLSRRFVLSRYIVNLDWESVFFWLLIVFCFLALADNARRNRTGRSTIVWPSGDSFAGGSTMGGGSSKRGGFGGSSFGGGAGGSFGGGGASGSW